MQATTRSDRSPRRQISSVAELRAGELSFELPLRDVSATGAFLDSDLLLEEGERYDLSFSLPGTEQNVEATGVVVRAQASRLAELGSGMGLHFAWVEAGAARALRQWIAA